MIPEAVEKEFLQNNKLATSTTERFGYIFSFYDTHSVWFRKCTDYNQADIDLYLTEPGIDEGEAEVFAQYQVRGSQHHLLLDERTARKFAESRDIPKNGVLVILALLDIRLKVCDYWECIQELTTITFHITETLAKKIYKDTQEKYA